ncbi:hypothetical protein [Iodobacter ciconiae]|uniref:Uncharacterized protein n=1 Tax=Iodobacter ciconiae TaxID=2496266 RepID=A0A3S8ZP49_9NEIS|nr:hypothetical protein [Iodobacter ciconiae]AZN35182.1 hypothetical protein EJO50_00970 [Iodobacter ciconiae]
MAEFANSKQIEVFFVPPVQVEGAIRPALNLDRVVEAGFYSSSRLSRGDRFNLKISNRSVSDGVHSVMSRLGLLLIDDQPSGRQYVTTLSGTASQAIYGERRAQGGTRSAIWYTENSRDRSLFPLLNIINLQPPQYFSGVANEQGQLSPGRMAALPGYINPAFNEQAFSDFIGMPVGKQHLLSFDGQRSGGDQSRYQLNLSKAAQLTLAPDGTCRAEQVDGVAGQVCILRKVGGESKASTGGDVRFRVSSTSLHSTLQARFRVSTVWHKLGESVGVAEFGQSKAIELFLPDVVSQSNEKKSSALTSANGEFYTPARNDDRFVIGMGIKISINLPKLVNQPRGGRLDYKPHLSGYNGGGKYIAPAVLNLQSLAVGQTFKLHAYPETEWWSGFSRPGQGSIWAPAGSPFTCGSSKPLGVNSDGTIPSGNKDFVFAFYSKERFIPCNGATPFYTPARDQQTATWYFGAGWFQIYIHRVANSGDQTAFRYPTIIPRVDPTDAGVFDFVGPSENQPSLNPGFYPDRDQGYPFPPTAAVVASLSATPNPVVEGSTTKVTVTLNKAALANQQVYVKFAGVSADISDLSSKGMLNLQNATSAVADLGAGGSVLVKEGVTQFTFDISTANDADNVVQSFEVRAKAGTADDAAAPKVAVNIDPISSPAVVASLSATPNPVTEGSTTKVTVTLDKAALANQQVYVKFAGVSADISDLSSKGMLNLQNATSAVADLGAGGAVSLNTGATQFTFDISTADDADNVMQSFEIRAKAGTADDAAAPKVSVDINPKVMVKSISATSPVLAGEPTLVTVELESPTTTATGQVYLKFVAQSADKDDIVSVVNMNSGSGASGVNDLSVGGPVMVNGNTRIFTFQVPTVADADGQPQTFVLFANGGAVESSSTGKSTQVTITPKAESLRVESVVASPKTVVAGGKVTFTVTLNKMVPVTRANQAVYVKFAGAGSSPAGINDLFSPGMINLQGAAGPVTDLSTGGAVAVRTGGRSFTFEVQTKADEEIFDEQFEMRANIGTQEDLLSQVKDTVTIEPAPLPAPSIEFSYVAIEQEGKFKNGALPIEMNYGVKIKNVETTSKFKNMQASKVGAYLKQRTLRAFVAGIKLENMGTANVAGTQYCTFTKDGGGKLIPLPISMVYEGLATPLDCNSITGISLGYPGVSGGWSAQDTTTYITKMQMKFTMGDVVSQQTSTGGYWYGIARSTGKLVLSLNVVQR